jgi:hypothetical protein
MKNLLTILLILFCQFSNAQISKQVGDLTKPKIIIVDQKKLPKGSKDSGKDDKSGSKILVGTPKVGPIDINKNIELPRALGFLTAKKYTRTLADGTKVTTSMYIKNVNPQVSSKTLGTAKTTVKPQSKKQENDPNWLCNVEQVKVSLNDESFMNAANEQQSSNLYPGAIYSFDNFFNGSFKNETAKRNPFRIITSAQGVSGNIYEDVKNTAPSEIRNAVNKLFKRMPNSKAMSGYRSTIYECNSLAEQMIKLTGGGGAYGFSASFGVNTKNRSEYRNFMIDCTQEMYSLSSEMPDSGFFANPNDANKDGLMVMSNVTYGQRVLVSITSKMTSNEFGTNFDAKYSGFGASANISLATFTSELSDETNVKIYIVGGENPGFVETDKRQLMNKLNEYFKNNSLQNAKPISYQFRNMNNDVVQSQSATDFFPVRKCIPAPPPGVSSADIKWRVSVTLNSITNETDMQESIHLGLQQSISVKGGTPNPIKPENLKSNNPQGYLIYWGGYRASTVPYEEPRTFKRSTNPEKTLTFVISQKDAEDGAYLNLISNYIAMVSTRFAGKTNESYNKYEERFPLKEILTKTSALKTFSINFNNRVFKCNYQIAAQKL